MLFTLAHTGVDVHSCDWCVVIFVHLLDFALLALVALIDVEVFRTNIEVLLVSLSEIKSVSIDWLSVVSRSTNRRLIGSSLSRILLVLGYREEVEVLGVNEHCRSPVAHLTVVGY